MLAEDPLSVSSMTKSGQMLPSDEISFPAPGRVKCSRTTSDGKKAPVVRCSGLIAICECLQNGAYLNWSPASAFQRPRFLNRHGPKDCWLRCGQSFPSALDPLKIASLRV